ncbi:MAG: hypothetical protein ACRC3K_12390, partial [Plesiomonas sp.]
MSYIDQGKTAYSYPLPNGLTTTPTPLSSPNQSGLGGAIPDGLAGFNLANGNYSAVVTLPV